MLIQRDTKRPDTIPLHLWGGLRDYLLDRVPVGGFLTAVLSNDLAAAVERADAESEKALPALIRWLNMHADSRAWGSMSKVRSWLRGSRRHAG